MTNVQHVHCWPQDTSETFLFLSGRSMPISRWWTLCGSEFRALHRSAVDLAAMSVLQMMSSVLAPMAKWMCGQAEPAAEAGIKGGYAGSNDETGGAWSMAEFVVPAG